MKEPLLASCKYHIYTHANGSENLFRSDENFYYFLKKYASHIYPVAETFAYCLMPNHLHVAVRIRTEEEVTDFLRLKKNDPSLQGFENLGGFSNIISRQFSNLFNAYTKAYNRAYNRKGSLFIPNFRRKLIDSDEYFTQVITYIHYNPVKHGFTRDIFDWPHSSIHAYASDKITRLNKHYLQEWFGDRDKLIAFHKEHTWAFDFMEV